MLDVSIRSVIQTFVGQIFANHVVTSFHKEGGVCTTRGVVFNFDVSIHDPKGDSTKTARTGVQVLVAGNHWAFGASGPSLHWGHDTQWANIGNHGSCWIDAVDTFLSDHYFSLCEVANPHARPADLEQQTWFSPFRPLQFVEVTLVQDPDNPGLSNAKKVTRVRSITKQDFDNLTKGHTL